VSGTDQTHENRLLLPGLAVKEIEAIHRRAADFSFIRRGGFLVQRGRSIADDLGHDAEGGRRQTKRS